MTPIRKTPATRRTAKTRGMSRTGGTTARAQIASAATKSAAIEPLLLGFDLQVLGEMTTRDYFAHVAYRANEGALALLAHAPQSFDEHADVPTPYATVLEMVASWREASDSPETARVAADLRELNARCGDANITLDSQEVYLALIAHAEMGMLLGLALGFHMTRRAEAGL
jgi:hypothetical protein